MAKGKEQPARIVILGGGYVGLYTALRLQKKLRAKEASVTVIDPQPHMTYLPFLPEAAAGSIEPRHVVVPLRRTLKKCHVVTASVNKIEHAERRVTVEAADGHTEEIGYDYLVVALGSITRLLPIPGLAEQGIGCKTIGEAIYLRNRVLSRMDLASSTLDSEERKKLLTFTVVGGGFSGIETLAELEDMSRYACRYYENIESSDLRWVLVEGTGRILPEVRESLGVWTAEQLEARGVEIYLDTLAKSFEGGHVQLSDGTEFDSDTIIWTAGVKANPVLGSSDLPIDKRGRLKVSAGLQVEEQPMVFSAGDCAAVPDLARTADDPTATCAPNAQHAVRQAKLLGKNLLTVLRGGKPKDYVHKNLGSVASLGLHKGVADAMGMKIKGFFAWLFHRAYHVMMMPTFPRKIQIQLDWAINGVFRREIVSMGQINEPKKAFKKASES
ncbi:NAD(P)/FAD-dependent oxidoreductase [Sciscionella marina]|uniref:NAD(P)/FAD-dependent oxidoreductase n=1 Tax=Sciscionella marina TaxID=508770 RepID=UPI00039DE830|nr:NAD(P)/FAD-dependent oxidoreductase [Sciscionella marina]